MVGTARGQVMVGKARGQLMVGKARGQLMVDKVRGHVMVDKARGQSMMRWTGQWGVSIPASLQGQAVSDMRDWTVTQEHGQNPHKFN